MTQEEFEALKVGDEVWVTDYADPFFEESYSMRGLVRKEVVKEREGFWRVEGQFGRLDCDCTFLTKEEATEVALDRLADSVRNQLGRRSWED